MIKILINLLIILSCFNYLEGRKIVLPKISLESYTEDDSFSSVEISKEFPNLTDSQPFENEFVRRNGSDYVMMQCAHIARFVCSAPYPIQWKFPFPEQFLGIKNWKISSKTERSSTFTGEYESPRDLKYLAYLTLRNTPNRENYQTGYISCQAINAAAQTRIYVWTQGKTVMDLMKEAIQVNISKSSTEVVIPCRPVLPEAVISLSKKVQVLDHRSILHSNATKPKYKWAQIPLGNSVTFDPKLGFLLTSNKHFNPGTKLLGQYRCNGSWDENQSWDGDSTNASNYKFVEVTLGNSEEKYEFEPRTTLKSIRDRVVLDSDSLQIHCCSGGAKNTSFGYSLNCNTEAECELIQDVFIRNSLNSKKVKKEDFSVLYGARGNCFYITRFQHLFEGKLVKCHSENMDVVGRYFTAIDPKDEKVNRFRGSVKIYNSSQNITLSQKIRFKFRVSDYIHPVFSRLYKFKNRHGHRFGRRGGYRRRYYYGGSIGFGGFSDLMSYGSRFGADSESEEIYEGMDIGVQCMPHHFFFAKGGWLRVNWKNGTRTVFKEAKLDRFGSSMDKEQLQQLRVYLSVSNDMIVGKIAATQEIKSVDCFAPLWNNEKWEKRTQAFNITPTPLPVFKNSTKSNEETIQSVDLDEENRTLNCSLVPSKQIYDTLISLKWTKDGKVLLDNKLFNISVEFGEQEIYTVLHFPKIIHETHGTYVCTAKNLKGEVFKEFKVFVKSKNKHNVEVVLLIVLLISFALLSTAIVVLSWKHFQLRVKLSKIIKF